MNPLYATCSAPADNVYDSAVTPTKPAAVSGATLAKKLVFSAPARGVLICLTAPHSTFGTASRSTPLQRQPFRIYIGDNGLEMDLPIHPGATSSSSSAVASPHSGADSTVVTKKAQDRPRHRKTRTGCFNCKRRRIKCKEERPACRNCVKSGYTCEYPAAARLYVAPDQVPRFTMLDMHFFQHFLLQCSPVYPLGNEQVWKHDVLCLSHNHDFLLYAVLGFAAADLEANGGTNTSLSVPAMTYRCKAIQLFRKAITSFQEPDKPSKSSMPTETKNPKPRRSAKIAGDPKPQTDSQHYGQSIMSFDQGSALVASCYLLMGQSQYLGDGIQDFMTLTRGSASLRAEMIRLGFPPLFQNLEPKDSIETMRRHLQEMPPLDKPWIDAGRDLAYLANLENILLYSKTDPFKVYTSVMGHFIWWQSLPFDEFQRVIDLTDQVNVLLAAHWVALMMAMAFLRKASMKINSDSKKKEEGHLRGLKGASAQAKEQGQCTEPWYYWLVCLNRWVNDDYKKFNVWPQWVQDRLEEDALYFYS
ncbi:hypothetical protein NLG97_g10460 [Lecanicillium saksenae]|uniref:Uncharacterized protein n=1 Tax=Lecanicillium saksenae TaxID=468837 RepID=A0ACC1QG44_9HYPO|nr:hypothetical protein NLG97_g10460 [Lecanicillium saksenae]